MKKQLTEIDSKLKTLRLKLKQAEEIIVKRDREAVERHRITILNLTRAIEDLRSSIEELKFSAGESEETVTTWSQEMAQQLSYANKACAELSKCAKVIDD
jgi:prefoldin subunit 5